MSLDSYSKEQHFHEIARKDSLNASVSFPVGVTALIAGGIALMTKTIIFPLSFVGLIQFNLVATSSILLVIACYLLVRTYWNYGYGHMPTAMELGKFSTKLSSFYQFSGHSSASAAAKAEQDTSVYITEQFAKNGDINSACNDKKSFYLYKANGFVIASIVPLILAAPLHFYQEALPSRQPIKVEIVQQSEETENVRTRQASADNSFSASAAPTTNPSGTPAEPNP